MMNVHSNYDLIRLHIDIANKGNLGHLIIVVERDNEVSIELEETFEFTEEISKVMALKVVDACMAASTKYPGEPIDALVYPSIVRKAIIAIGTQFGPVRFALFSELNRESAGGKLVTENIAEWNENVKRENPSGSKDQSLVYVATDGSLNKFYAGGSYAWIASDGRFGYGDVSASSVLICELRAISEMLAKVKRNNLRILVDNRLAIKLSREPNSMDHSSMVTPEAKRLATRINSSLNSRTNVELRWVKGHSGHPLNEGADRLARNARLSHSFKQDNGNTMKIAEGIAADIIQEYSTYPERTM